METPRYEAEGRIAEVLVAAAFVLVVGGVLWPPEAVYWTRLEPVVGETVTLGIVGGLALGVGAWFARTTALSVVHLVLGGVVAYLVGMGAIEVLLQPDDSPVHLLLYGGLLGTIVAGALLWTGIERAVGA